MKYWTDRYEDKVVEIIQQWFDYCETELELEFMDNLRVAKASIPEEVAAYEKAYEDGCCGFKDDAIMISDDDDSNGIAAYLVGFNYGH